MNLSYSAEYEQFRQEVRTFLRETWTDEGVEILPDRPATVRAVLRVR